MRTSFFSLRFLACFEDLIQNVNKTLLPFSIFKSSPLTDILTPITYWYHHCKPSCITFKEINLSSVLTRNNLNSCDYYLRVHREEAIFLILFFSKVTIYQNLTLVHKKPEVSGTLTISSIEPPRKILTKFGEP